MRLNKRQREEFEIELGRELTPSLTSAIEDALTTYKHHPQRRITAADTKRWRAEHRQRIAAARWLLHHPSTEDIIDAIDRGTERSTLQEQLAARLSKWESQSTYVAAANHPEDWPRRRLLYHVLLALDAARIRTTYHREGPRVLALRQVLRCADAIDKRRASGGSERLIRAVYRDYRARETWGPRSVLRLMYEKQWTL